MWSCPKVHEISFKTIILMIALTFVGMTCFGAAAYGQEKKSIVNSTIASGEQNFSAILYKETNDNGEDLIKVKLDVGNEGESEGSSRMVDLELLELVVKAGKELGQMKGLMMCDKRICCWGSPCVKEGCFWPKPLKCGARPPLKYQ